MCHRFALTAKPTALQLALDLGNVPSKLMPSEDYYPGKGIPAVVNAETRDVEILYWGLVPPWAKDITIAKHTFNARAETLMEKASFKNAFLRRRCLIPAGAYFEWKTVYQKTGPIDPQLSLWGAEPTPADHSVKAVRTPFRFSLKETPLFMLAGLWEYWCDPNGNELYSASVVTCPAGDGLEEFHPRMPVILTKENCWQWMEDRPASELQQLLAPLPAECFEIREAA